jgi:NADH-quinone oxidoreductase subunit L
MLYGGWFGESIASTATMAEMAKLFHGAGAMVLHAFGTLPFWLAVSGAATAWFLYIKRPDLPPVIKARLAPFAWVLEKKYGFDDFNDWFFAGGSRLLGRGLCKGGDQVLIDGLAVNGSARLVGRFAFVVRRLQSGYLYQYAFSMIIGVFVLLTLWLNRT